MKVVWNPEAKKDLQTICDHYRQFSSGSANKVTRGIVLSTRKLKSFPKIGRKVPEIGDPDFREVIWNGWRIIYMFPAEGEEPIEIMNIIHSAKKFGET